MIKEAVILAGGKGTRLRSVVSDVPKPMAQVAGRPFLCYLLDKLEEAGFTHIVLSTGYLREVVRAYFGNSYRSLEISYSEEVEPLGTGGGIAKAAQYVKGESFVVLNGDTYFAVDYAALIEAFECKQADFLLVAREIEENTRYGGVGIDRDGRITYFGKEPLKTINGGIYVIDKSWLTRVAPAEVFSFENDLLAQRFETDAMYAVVAKTYFIDIGIPEDYARAQTEFKAPEFFSPRWLFLDRDGVINVKRDNDYVKTWSEFVFIPGVKEALKLLAQRFEKIVIVSNQQGVGKGVMTREAMDEIHLHMCEDVNEAGGRIDAVFTCTDLVSANSPNRKPETGMGLQAQQHYPEIDFTRSVMAGDADSDMLFGYRLRMQTVRISPEYTLLDYARDLETVHPTR